MNSLIDSHRVIGILKRQGFTEQQAEGIVEAMTAQDFNLLATKEDVRLAKDDLKEEIHHLEIRMIKWFTPMLIGQLAVFTAIVGWMLGR